MTATNMCSNFGGKWDSPLKISCHVHVEANANIVAPSSSGWSSHAPTCCMSLLLVVVAGPLMLQLVVCHCS